MDLQMEKTGSISRGRVLSRCPRWSCESHYHAPAPTPSTSHPPLPPAKALPAEGRWPHVLSRPRHTRCGEFPVIVLSPAAAWCVPAHPFTFRRCQRVDASSRRAALAEHADARVRGRGGRRRVRPGGGGGDQRAHQRHVLAILHGCRETPALTRGWRSSTEPCYSPAP
jgi:hypothetical protein